MTQQRTTIRGLLVTSIAAVGVSCASGTGGTGSQTGGSASPAALTFEQALIADSSTFDPPVAFRAVAESDWAQAAMTGSVAGTVVQGTRWRLGESCEVHFTAEPDVLAAAESSQPTHKLGADACHGHNGFWQMSAGRVFIWMPLAGNWSVEYYGDFVDDSTMLLRRYPLRRVGPRTWRPDRDAAVVARATRIVETKPAVKASYDVTRALRAVGEADWATRPGAGSAASVAGTRWKTPAGCVLTFATTVVARAAQGQRLTRSLTSTECDGLKGSWQQVGKRVFWLVNIDSLTAVETYADVADTIMRARHFDLKRASPREAYQATWDPTRSYTLSRVRR